MRIDLPATFRKIFQHIFSCFEFGSEIDPQNTGLLRVVECDHIFGLAFNLGNLRESRAKFTRGQWRGRERVRNINYIFRDISYAWKFKLEGRMCKTY